MPGDIIRSQGHAKSSGKSVNTNKTMAAKRLVPYLALTAACTILIYTLFSSKAIDQNMFLPATQIQAQYDSSLPDARKKYTAISSQAFSSYQCTGEELGDVIYNGPFRFHVYNDMPTPLLDDVIQRAKKYWMPDHRFDTLPCTCNFS